MIQITTTKRTDETFEATLAINGEQKATYWSLWGESLPTFMQRVNQMAEEIYRFAKI